MKIYYFCNGIMNPLTEHSYQDIIIMNNERIAKNEETKDVVPIKNTLQPKPALPPIESMIMEIRGQQVMLDRDLAMLYGVETKALNQAVKRNKERFPNHFHFQLDNEEFNGLVTNCDRFEKLKHSSFAPFAFTEQGVAMLSTVLRGPVAVNVSIRIIDAFVAMRHILVHSYGDMLHQRVETLENSQLQLLNRQAESDKRIDEVFRRLDHGHTIPAQGIFYEGQIFDAYTFAVDLIKSAKTQIILMDNYIDESVLLMLSKRREGVSALIVTRRITETLQLDLERHQKQYQPIKVQERADFHDRFLCIDDTVYHLGASLKDLGKKLFAFSRMEMPMEYLLGKQ